MGLFGRFFSTRSHSFGVDRKIEVQSLGSRLVRLPALDHFGPYSHSPNRRYTLVWRDGVEGRGGARAGGDGRYVLLDDGKLVVDGHMQRPNDGKVADNGTFVLNDWRFSNDLSGIFWAFRADGSVILSRSFSANLLNNGLSADGAFACCQTANASTKDGSVLAVFDLFDGKEISVFTPESGWASDYEFLPEIGTVRLLYAQDGDAFAYGLDGEFTEREKWVATRLDRGDIYIVKRVMDEVDNQPEPQLAARLLASIEAGLCRLDARDKYSLSLAWKLKGEILEVLKMPQDALSAYERALTSNPNIGVKRHAERLRKALRRGGR